jgi:hypothetical protein
MGIVPLHDRLGEAEPSPAELAAIEAEWPLIAAELDLLDAQIAVLSLEGAAGSLDWRRIRRAEHRVLATRQALTDAGRAAAESAGVA